MGGGGGGGGGGVNFAPLLKCTIIIIEQLN